MKRILFVSALDFKEKSIQVIRKTPEKFVSEGWEVDYVVLRDNSVLDNYRYENEINPQGIRVFRFYLRLTKLMAILKDYRFLRRPLQKLAYFIGLIRVIYFILINSNKLGIYDVIYGYEVQGVIALKISRFFGFNRTAVFVSRFQGSFLYDYLKNRRLLKILGNIDDLIAFMVRSDLAIITNDGTMADRAYRLVNNYKDSNMVFWPNGSDPKTEVTNGQGLNLSKKNKITTFLTVSRLAKWKRVDRAIDLVASLNAKLPCRLIIVGDGPERPRLQAKVTNLGIQNIVLFKGAIDASEVSKYYDAADYFLSFYEGSNVGNPLFEAIRHHKIVCTLSNGDTESWIQHKKNGLIYNDFELSIDNIIDDLECLIADGDLRNVLINNVCLLEKLKLRTWEERLNDEFELVNSMIS